MGVGHVRRYIISDHGPCSIQVGPGTVMRFRHLRTKDAKFPVCSVSWTEKGGWSWLSCGACDNRRIMNNNNPAQHRSRRQKWDGCHPRAGTSLHLEHGISRRSHHTAGHGEHSLCDNGQSTGWRYWYGVRSSLVSSVSVNLGGREDVAVPSASLAQSPEACGNKNAGSKSCWRSGGCG